MLRITVPATEMWDDRKEEFVYTEEQTLELEHSLVSLQTWESKWHQAFFSKYREKTDEEIFDYIRCMTLTPNVEPEVYGCLTRHNINQIVEYINEPMTATVLPKSNGGANSRETVTAELIYYWMIALNIPFECETWHINRLLTLVGVCNVKNSPPKKMSTRELMNRNASLNAQRKAQLNTRG